MKNIANLTVACLILLSVSCTGLVEGLNDNPNSPTTAPFSTVLTGAEVGSTILQTGETARRAGIFCGYYTGIDRQHLGFSNYTVTTSDFDALWENGFIKAIRNARVAEETAEEQGLEGITIGISQVLKALGLGTEASLFGKVPFDDAGDFSVENPAFEDQLAVYTKLQDLLDQAIVNLESGGDRPANGADFYLDGDADAWIEVAYTLKARYHLHNREYEEAYAAAQNGIASIESSLYSPHGSALDNSNLTYQFFAVQSRSTDVVVSDFMTSLVAPSADLSPDINAYRGNAKTNETGRYGFYFQVTGVGTQPNTIDGFAAAEASAPIATYQENLLILAEAGFRTEGFSTGLSRLNDYRAFMNAGGYLTNAEPSDILYEAYVTADFNSSGMENPDNISADNALLREILEERYVTLFSQIEGFCDTRRTLNETIVRVPVQPNSGSELPQRFVYPQSEIDRNVNIPNPIPGLFEPTEINL